MTQYPPKLDTNFLVVFLQPHIDSVDCVRVEGGGRGAFREHWMRVRRCSTAHCHCPRVMWGQAPALSGCERCASWCLPFSSSSASPCLVAEFGAVDVDGEILHRSQVHARTPLLQCYDVHCGSPCPPDPTHTRTRLRLMMRIL